MSDFAEEDDTRFPPELVGRPTSEVLKHLAEVFREYSSEGSPHTADGYYCAGMWLQHWAEDAEKIEDERRRKAR